jgi:hypothetical protein
LPSKNWTLNRYATQRHTTHSSTEHDSDGNAC